MHLSALEWDRVPCSVARVVRPVIMILVIATISVKRTTDRHATVMCGFASL